MGKKCPCWYCRPKNDSVNHPKHYTAHPSGVECITITEHMGFCLGNVIKYVWRADLKGESEHARIEDLKKAEFYLRREIAHREQIGCNQGVSARKGKARHCPTSGIPARDGGSGKRRARRR